MGTGCIRAARGATEPDDLYMERPEVKQLLKRLRSDRPENLAKWLGERRLSSELTTSNRAPSPRSSANTLSAIHAVRRVRSSLELPCSSSSRKVGEDWRYNIFDAEKSVLKSSKEWLRKQEKKTTHVATPDARLHSFLPDVIIGAILDGRIKISDPMKVLMESPMSSGYKPVVRSFHAAVVFMDASGFTSLTEKLAQEPTGAEEIGKCINNFFAPLIEIVRNFGGDILKFSGDAVTILWPIRSRRISVDSEGRPADGETTEASWSPDAGTAVDAACRCCLEVQSKVGKQVLPGGTVFGSTPIEGLSLTLHIGMGVGKVNLLQLGGLLNRWEYCAAGPPLEEVASAEALAKSGETVVSRSVIETLKDAELHRDFIFQAVPQGCGYHSLTGYGVNASKTPGSILSSILPATGNDSAPSFVPLELSIVQRYVPRTIMRMVTGDCMSDEMRRATIVFLSIGNLDPGRNEGDANRVQVIARLLQRSIYALEGSLNKILVDDKGLLLLACFGLPPLNHYTDDPLRAVLAAGRFIDTLREEDIIGRAGVATGKCWCGIVGSALRREYTVLGDVVNLAARLMGSANENECRVDEDTQRACKHILEFSGPQTIALKGKAKPLPFYMFTGNLKSKHKGVQKPLDSTLMNWKGWPVISKLHHALEQQVKGQGPCRGPGGVIFVKGQAGCGKTEVAARIRTWARDRGCSLLNGQNMNATATFAVQLQCWVEVFRDLMATAAGDPYWQARLEEDGMPSGDLMDSSAFKWNLMTTMLQSGGADEDLMAWAPLMNIVLSSLDFGSKEVHAMLERDEQHSNGRSRLGELCVKLIDGFASFGSNKAGTVILLHIKASTSFHQVYDYHSSRIFDAVAQLCLDKRNEPNARPLVFCVVSRDDIVDVEGDGLIIKKAHECKGVVEVEDLDLDLTGDFLGECLQNPELHKELVDYVHRASGGNLFAIKDLCQSMKDQQALTEVQGKSGSWQLAAEWQDPEKLVQELNYPDTMVGIALAQFEKLEPLEQHILKIAAVFVAETSCDLDSSFTALDLSESQGFPSQKAIQIDKCCRKLKDIGILKEGTMSRRGSLVSSQGSMVNGQQSMNSSLESTGSFPDDTLFKFKSMLLRHVASLLVLRAQHGDILDNIAKSRRASRLLTTATVSGRWGSSAIEASLSSALNAEDYGNAATPVRAPRSSLRGLGISLWG